MAVLMEGEVMRALTQGQAMAALETAGKGTVARINGAMEGATAARNHPMQGRPNRRNPSRCRMEELT